MHLNTFSNVMYCCDAKLSIITPVFSVTWFFRKKSNMLIYCSRNISYYYQCWKQLCCIILLWKFWYFFFLSEFLNEYKVQKKSIYVNMFCNMCLLSFVINWMHPGWIKVLIYYWKNEPTHILWTVVKLLNFLLLWH